jgi:hypothetical protein
MMSAFAAQRPIEAAGPPSWRDRKVSPTAASYPQRPQKSHFPSKHLQILSGIHLALENWRLKLK